jgi:hypothetical protein
MCIFLCSICRKNDTIANKSNIFAMNNKLFDELFDLPVELSIKILKIAAKHKFHYLERFFVILYDCFTEEDEKETIPNKQTIEISVDVSFDYDEENYDENSYVPYKYTIEDYQKIINSYGKYILKDPTFEHTLENYIYYSKFIIKQYIFNRWQDIIDDNGEYANYGELE